MPRSRRPLLAPVLLCLLLPAVRAQTGNGDCPRSETRLACQDLLSQEGRWRRIQDQLEVNASRFQDVILTDPRAAERAFDSFGIRNHKLGEAKGQLPSGTGTGTGTGTIPNMGGLSTSSTGTGNGNTLAVGDLTEEEARLLLPRRQDHLLLRIRARIKTEAIQDRTRYGKVVPIQGLHPYQIQLLSHRVTYSSDLALNETLARLADLFTLNPTRLPANGLAHAFIQKDTREILKGYATYRYYRAYPGNDARVVEATLRGLRDLSTRGLRSGERAGPTNIFFQSLLDMFQAAKDAGQSDARIVDLLFAVFVDYQMASLGLAGRIQSTGSDAGELAQNRGRRVLDALTVDPVFSNHRFVASTGTDQAFTSPFGNLEAGEHLRRLRHFSDRLARARTLLTEALRKMEQAEDQRLQAGSRDRLTNEVSRITFGPNPQAPSPESVVGILFSPEFEAERRYLLAQGTSGDAGVREAYQRIFGDQSRPGELDRVMQILRQSVLPFLRGGRVQSGREPPRQVDELLRSRQEIDRLRDELRRIDEELYRLAGQNPNDPGVRQRIEQLQRERERLLGEFDRRAQTHLPRGPRELTDRFRTVQDTLRSGQVPDGRGGYRPITQDERRVLEREADSLQRTLNPTPQEAGRRADQLDDMLRRGVDMRGQPVTDPQVLDDIRAERDRMRAISRGETRNPPGYQPGDRDLFPPRDPFNPTGTPGYTPGSGTGPGTYDPFRPDPARQPPAILPSGQPQTIDPNTGRRIDPTTGRQIDPVTGLPGPAPTGQPINPVTGRPSDPRTGNTLPVDPVTRNPVDTSTGRQIDPRTGELGPRSNGTPVNPVTNRPVNTGTGTGSGSTGTGSGSPPDPEGFTSSGAPRAPGTSDDGTVSTDETGGSTGGSTGSSTGGSTGGTASGSTELPPEAIESLANGKVAEWMATNGPNRFGLPQGAPESEILTLLQQEANKLPKPEGFSYNARGQLVGGNSTGTASAGNSPDGNIWPPQAIQAVAEILQQRIDAQKAAALVQIKGQQGGTGSNGSGGPTAQSAGR